MVQKMALGQAFFLLILWFSMLVIILPVLHTHLSSGAGTTSLYEATVPKDLFLSHSCHCYIEGMEMIQKGTNHFKCKTFHT